MTLPVAVQPRRIGVFGGAFDPPHLGHHALAVAAIDQLRLDLLHIIPTGHAWHKSRTLSDAYHRLEMARLAFADLAQVLIDERELLRPGPTYTVDTLQHLQRENPGAQLYLLIGEDQARALPSWSRWEQVPALAIICVAVRADSTGARGQFDTLMAQVPSLRVLNMPPVAISATDIRHRAAMGQSIDPLVFETVARYIDQHHLYRPT